MVKKSKQREIFEEAVDYFWDDFDIEGDFNVYELATKIELFMDQHPHRVELTGLHAALSGLIAARYKEDGDDWHELNNEGSFLVSVWLTGWRMAIQRFDPDLANTEAVK